MRNKDYFYNFTIQGLILTLSTYRQTLVNKEDARKYYFWIPHYQRHCKEILRERDGTLLFLTLIFFNNIDDLNETLDPNGMDAEDYLEFLIRTELKIKRLGRERHRNCRCCKESLSEKRPCLRV